MGLEKDGFDGFDGFQCFYSLHSVPTISLIYFVTLSGSTIYSLFNHYSKLQKMFLLKKWIYELKKVI